MLISSVLLLLPALAYGNLVLNYPGESSTNSKHPTYYQVKINK